jgi:hypothetical protein
VSGEPIPAATCIGLSLIVGAIVFQQRQTQQADKKIPLSRIRPRGKSNTGPRADKRKNALIR